jgi:limonene-1,2-epoxide hydrolase
MQRHRYLTSKSIKTNYYARPTGSINPIDAEAVVRSLCKAFLRTDIDELLAYFTQDAVYEKIPAGCFDGQDEIRGTLDVFFGPEVKVEFEILHSVSDGTVACVERTVHFETGSGKIDLPAMAVFEVNEAGKITPWRDYFDRRQAGLE